MAPSHSGVYQGRPGLSPSHPGLSLSHSGMFPSNSGLSPSHSGMFCFLRNLPPPIPYKRLDDICSQGVV